MTEITTTATAPATLKSAGITWSPARGRDNGDLTGSPSVGNGTEWHVTRTSGGWSVQKYNRMRNAVVIDLGSFATVDEAKSAADAHDVDAAATDYSRGYRDGYRRAVATSADVAVSAERLVELWTRSEVDEHTEKVRDGLRKLWPELAADLDGLGRAVAGAASAAPAR